MTTTSVIDNASYTHDVLVHDDDEALVAETRAFVELGLAASGQVLVHSSRERVDLLRDALGAEEGLTYGYDEELYQAPMSTLFAYQRAIAQGTGPGGLWVTGTVPIPADRKGQAAWARYESLVNEVLGSYAFHALCTYDTRALPPHVIAGARATHPHTGAAGSRWQAPEYQPPAAFLDDPLALTPTAPTGPPSLTTTVTALRDLHRARTLLAMAVVEADLAPETGSDLVSAANEVLVNALSHGAPPVRLDVWLAPGEVTALVTDEGPGVPDRLAGFRHPDADGPAGLWVARQLCADLVLSNLDGRGCAALLTTA